MKSHRFQPRFYRAWTTSAGLYSLRLSVRETDLMIAADLPLRRAFCHERVRSLRAQIEDYGTRKDPRFFSSLKPLAVDPFAAPIIREMAAASAAANVGPMAAVAGAVAEHLGRALLEHGCTEVIVENGGDLFVKVRRPVRVALFAGDSPFTGTLSFELRPSQTPCGIATSSGTVGHSLSFGKADSVTVFADTGARADACATAVCNRVGSAADFAKALEHAASIPGCRACICVCGNELGAWGDVRLARTARLKNNYSKNRFQRREKMLDKAGRYDKKMK